MIYDQAGRNACASIALQAAGFFLNGYTITQPSDLYRLIDEGVGLHSEKFGDTKIFFESLSDSIVQLGLEVVPPSRAINDITEDGLAIMQEMPLYAPVRGSVKSGFSQVLEQLNEIQPTPCGILTCQGVTLCTGLQDGMPFLFDSHSTPEHGASFLLFDDMDALDSHLNSLFPASEEYIFHYITKKGGEETIPELLTMERRDQLRLLKGAPDKVRREAGKKLAALSRQQLNDFLPKIPGQALVLLSNVAFKELDLSQITKSQWEDFCEDNPTEWVEAKLRLLSPEKFEEYIDNFPEIMIKGLKKNNSGV